MDSKQKANADYLMEKALEAGITKPKSLANFMGQMQVECGGFGHMHENLNYSVPRLLKVFPGRNGIDTVKEAQAVVSQGKEAIAEAIYGGKWGAQNLGNTEAGDGWKYHGRGYVQLTGRANYEEASKALGVDLVNQPELASDREIASKIAVWYWESRVVPKHHEDNVTKACKDINGGYKGLSERIEAAETWEKRLHQGYIEKNHVGVGSQEKAYHYNNSQLEEIKPQNAPSKPYQQSANEIEPATQFAANEVPARYAALHGQVHEHISRLYTEKGIAWSNGGENTVAKCTAGCVEKNVTEAQFASVENGKINIGQKDGFVWNVATVDAVQAARTPQLESFAQLAALDLQQSQQQDNPTQQQTQARSGPSMG